VLGWLGNNSELDEAWGEESMCGLECQVHGIGRCLGSFDRAMSAVFLRNLTMSCCSECCIGRSFGPGECSERLNDWEEGVVHLS
jgi:hypothetical protein